MNEEPYTAAKLAAAMMKIYLRFQFLTVYLDRENDYQSKYAAEIQEVLDEFEVSTWGIE